ncbi:hypothetical protein D3C84_1220220 [compost metagenome]
MAEVDHAAVVEARLPVRYVRVDRRVMSPLGKIQAEVRHDVVEAPVVLGEPLVGIDE